MNPYYWTSQLVQLNVCSRLRLLAVVCVLYLPTRSIVMENIGNNLIFKCKTRKMGFLYAPKHKHMTLLFGLRPATPGWGVGASVCLCAHSACTPSLLAWVGGVGVCAWARVLGCAPPLLAGALGRVCACVRAPVVPRHSRLGCAVWVCVLGLGFWLHPATPGRGVGVCACLCARSACTPPLLAGVCGVGVCAWARVSVAPRHSLLGCWGVCVFVCAFRLYHAPRGSVVRCGCVCWGSGLGCAPPVLAGVLGCVCGCVRAPLVPRHSWHGCAAWVFVLGLRFRLRPATAGWGVGVCVCLCARSACTPPLLAGVCSLGVCAWLGFRLRLTTPFFWTVHPRVTPGVLGGVGVCACARALAATRHSSLGRWGACVLGARSAGAPPLLAQVCGAGVCAWARVSAAPRHSWLGCWGVCVLGARSAGTPPLLARLCGRVCVLGLGARLRPATPGWGVGLCVFVLAPGLYPATPGWCVWCGCVCLGSGFGCAPPLLAGVLGCVCACVAAPLVPRHSWLGCAVWVCVLGLGFWLRPTTPGWAVGVCVCLCGRSSCAPPLLAGWAVWVCVLGLEFRLRPATPGWGVGVCVCLCGRSSCAPPLLARMCRLGVCGWARVPAALRHSWLGCWGVCVLVCALRLYPATPGWGVRLGCLCLGSGFGCAPPLLAGLLGCACLCALSACTPPFLARVCGVGACAWAPASGAPRHSWLGCAVWVCVLGLGRRLRPASPGPRLSWLGCCGVCVCLCASSACTPPLPARVHGVGGCAWAWVSAAPRHSCPGCWGVCVFVCALRLYPATPGLGVRCRCACLGLGFDCAPPLMAGVSGCVCACVRAPLVPRLSWLGFVVCWFGVAGHLSLCRGSLRVVRAAQVCGTRWPLLLGTCPFALVVVGGVPLWRAWWPGFGAPRLVRSGCSRCSFRLFGRRGAVPHPRGLRPRLYWVAARSTRRPAENRAHCACRWPPPWLGRWARSASYPFGAPRWGCPWRVPPAPVLGCMRFSCFRVWTRSLTRPVSRAVRLSTRDSAGAPGLLHVDADTAPFGSEDATRGSRACVRVRVLLVWVGQAGLLGALWCASSFPVARLAVLFVCSGPSRLGFALFFFFLCAPVVSGVPSLGPGCPHLVSCPSPPPFFFLSPLFLFFLRPRCVWLSVFPGPGCLGPWLFLVSPSPTLFFFRFASLLFFLLPWLFFFCFFLFVRPRCLLRSVFSGPGCLGPWRLLV